MDVDLEHANEVIDPRHYGGDEGEYRFFVNGTTLTIARIDTHEEEGWDIGFWLRAYLPTDTIPDFTSTVYTYHGLEYERAPKDTTEIIFHPSVTIIKKWAFYECRSLERVTIPDTVTRIEVGAFFNCRSLRFIRLSTNLASIGSGAFRGCSSLEAAFLPPTVTHIGNMAFCRCKSLRFLYVHESIQFITQRIIKGCDQLSTTVSNNLTKVC